MIDHRLGAGLVGNISPNEAHGRTTLRRQRLSCGLAAACGNDMRAGRNEDFRDAFANATSCTSYDGDFAAKFAHLLLPAFAPQRGLWMAKLTVIPQHHLHFANDCGDAVEIRVRDNGTGIMANIKDKLFQPFFTTKPTGEGTALAFNHVDIVTKQHSGSLTVDSKMGEYSEFMIRLPRYH